MPTLKQQTQSERMCTNSFHPNCEIHYPPLYIPGLDKRTDLVVDGVKEKLPKTDEL